MGNVGNKNSSNDNNNYNHNHKNNIPKCFLNSLSSSASRNNTTSTKKTATKTKCTHTPAVCKSHVSKWHMLEWWIPTCGGIGYHTNIGSQWCVHAGYWSKLYGTQVWYVIYVIRIYEYCIVICQWYTAALLCKYRFFFSTVHGLVWVTYNNFLTYTCAYCFFFFAFWLVDTPTLDTMICTMHDNNGT